MANPFDPRAAYAAPVAAPATFDAGLRSYMLSVYNTMASGVLLTGIVALFMARGGANSIAAQIFLQPGFLKYVIMLAPLGMVIWLNAGISRMSESAVKALFWVFAAVMGASLSTIFLRYTGGSIAATFFATSASFASLSLYGYTTKRDLGGVGKFLLMGLVGLVVASIANIFLHSGALDLIVSVIGVFIFAGLTVYDTQKVRQMYDVVAGTDMAGKSIVMGALTLYLDFINLFLFMLRFMGGGRSN